MEESLSKNKYFFSSLSQMIHFFADKKEKKRNFILVKHFFSNTDWHVWTRQVVSAAAQSDITGEETWKLFVFPNISTLWSLHFWLHTVTVLVWWCERTFHELAVCQCYILYVNISAPLLQKLLLKAVRVLVSSLKMLCEKLIFILRKRRRLFVNFRRQEP